MAEMKEEMRYLGRFKNAIENIRDGSKNVET